MDISDIENNKNVLNISNPTAIESESINNDDLLNKLSNDHEEDEENDDCLIRNSTSIHKKRVAIIDSDEEEPATSHNTNFDKNLSKTAPEDAVENSLKLYSKLCDSESSDEENGKEMESPIIPIKSKLSSNRPQKLVEENPKKMTAKEALQQRREIWSESQRMTRETNVSLPYHRPKTRTLKEFFEQRPKFSTSVPDGSVCVKPAIALKMNMQQLELVSKNLKEREKQIERYFKSEDDEISEKNKVDVEQTKSEEEINKEDGANNPEDQKNLNNEKGADEDCDLVNINNDMVEKCIEEIGSKNITLLENILIQPAKNEDSLIQSHEEITQNVLEPESKPKNVSDIIREKYGNFKPSLTKSKDFIDLDENVNELKERFIKHTAKKLPHKHNVHLDIVNVTNDEIHKEKLEITIEDDTIPIIEKPGERLKKLKDELEMKIAEEQTKFWKERAEKKPEMDEDEKVKQIDDDDDEYEDILDTIDNDEEEFTEIEDDEDGGEIIGDDDDENEEMEEKSKRKSEFLENEAEESDCGDCDDGEEMDVDNEENEEENENNSDADDEDECSKEDNNKKKKRLKRIIQVFENDSDEETENVPANIITKSDSESVPLDTTETMDDLSAPTPHQKRNDYTPVKPYMTQSKTELGFLTPVYHLTGLQSLNSKFLHDSPVSPFVLPKTSPLRMSQSGPQKKLFADDNALESQSTLDDLEHLCSGKFVTQSQNLSTTNNTEKSVRTEIYADSENSTQELLNICSGKFTGVTQLEPSANDKDENTNLDPIEKLENEEKSVESKILPKCTIYTSIKTSNDEIKNFNDVDDEKLILGLLEEDEEELESFKKKFESPQNLIRGKILDSDDEEQCPTINIKKKVRNCIQDDDEDENNQVLDNENSDSEEDLDNVQNKVEEIPEIEYDSEENEIEIEQKQGMKIADFFEKEAELSESEWGSADEDEKGIDDLEFEEGDNDKLDERKIKRDLERIHMRRILDDDNHEVKILQELLLDDGEMHGKGRERQFKWRNINNDENDTRKDEDDGEIYLDDENENEEEWRKKRYEREIFLKKQQDSIRIEETTLEIQSTSQIFKLGEAAIKRSLSNTSNNSNNTNQEKSNSPDFKSSFTLTNKKGSFLTRSEQVLARVAELTSKTVNPTIGGAKNSRNFVFHTIEIEEQTVKKRKADDGKLGTPISLKRLRLNNISPAVKKKSENTDRVKKLFTNW
nr:claspin-like [Onthophagus taurus]